MQKYAIGDKVEWQWGQGFADGEIKKVYTSEITKVVQGTEVTRKASEDQPAYLIVQEDGAEVLKAHSEVKKSG